MPEYPPPAFYFAVRIDGSDEEARFQEAAGIGSEMGGETRFVHALPKAAKHGPLRLKRGVVAADSPLIVWCREVLESGLQAAIERKTVEVYLVDEKADRVQGWRFADAYPVKWAVEAFGSGKSDVAVESIEIDYTYSSRV